MNNLFKFRLRFFALMAIFLVIVSGAFAQRTDTIAIIDAGSSGSRLYVYEIKTKGIKCIYPTKDLTNLSKGDPLSAFLKKGNSDVVEFLNSMTSKFDNRNKPQKDLYILATAGMRMEDSTTVKSLYKYIKDTIITSGNYKIKEAMTISGRYEGLYAWIAANYENKSLGLVTSSSGISLTYTETPCNIIEIGGASMQIAFAIDPLKTKDSNSCLSRNGFSNIYSKSYLGGGVDEIFKCHGNINGRAQYQLKLPNINNDCNREHKFFGLGMPIGIVLDGIKDKSISEYIETIKGHDSTENHHPRSNANYIGWVLEQTGLIGTTRISKPTQESSWTLGAALDIIFNNKTPEKFNYTTPN